MLDNKIVKRLDQRTYFQKTQEWLARFPFFLRIGCVLVTVLTLYCLFACEHNDTRSVLNVQMLACRNISQLLIFYGITVSNLYSNQLKGSSPFVINMCLSTTIACLISYSTSFAIKLFFQLKIYTTSIPVLVGLIAISQDSLSIDQPTNHILGLPFQIKKKFYPAALIILLELLHQRIDVIPIYLIGLFMAVIKFNNLIQKIGKYVEKPLCCCLINFECFKKSDEQIIKEKPLQHVITSNSVVFEDV